MAFTPGPTMPLRLDAKPLTAPLHPDYSQVALLNTGPALAFVVFGVGPLGPEAHGFPLAVNVPVILTKGVGADTIMAWAAGSATLFVTPGSGA